MQTPDCLGINKASLCLKDCNFKLLCANEFDRKEMAKTTAMKVLKSIPKEDLLYDELNNFIVTEIYKILERTGFTEKELASKIPGFTTKQIENFLSGHYNIDTKTIAKILSALGYTRLPSFFHKEYDI